MYLRCSQGSLEWIYPTGAIIVNLRPNTVSPAAAHLSVCIKPSAESSGTNIYLDKAGKLRLLLHEEEQSRARVHCFSIQEGAVFIEAVLHQDISRRITAFQYELVADLPGTNSLTGMSSVWQQVLISPSACVCVSLCLSLCLMPVAPASTGAN